MTLTILWKNHCKTLIKLSWKYHSPNYNHFYFSIFRGPIVSKRENFDTVVIHQFWSKWPETKPQWIILVHITPNFVPKTHFFELRCPTAQMWLMAQMKANGMPTKECKLVCQTLFSFALTKLTLWCWFYKQFAAKNMRPKVKKRPPTTDMKLKMAPYQTDLNHLQHIAHWAEMD